MVRLLFLPLLSLLLASVATLAPTPSHAANVVEVPILGAIQANDQGVFTVLVLSWDRRPAPDPIELAWGNQRMRIQGSGLEALGNAFRYALNRVPVARTGTISIYGAAYAPVGSEGPSAGAVMAVGFIAVLRGDAIRRGIALTGTLDASGRIGPVGAIPDKIRSAAREGYRTVLIPEGQFFDPQWNLQSLSLELNVTVTEVGTIEEAYELMTGKRL
ncbi:S16 family serine protease [Nitrospira sp. Kam-Ns4a]